MSIQAHHAIFQEALAQLGQRHSLSQDIAQASVEHLMSGEAAAEDVKTFLLGLREKGETVDEVVGGAQALRAHMAPFPISAKDLAHAVDTCGTGGDELGTINVSTMSAFIVAAAGVPVVKHGNRSASSRCGSADVLEALGIHVQATPEHVAACFKRTNMAFLFAPTFHPAMQHVGPIRKALGVRTLFNLLGPLANPAGVQRQVVGVSTAPHVALLAQAFQALSAEHVAVVHGADGLDEITTTGTTQIAEVTRARSDVMSQAFDPEQSLGIHRASLDQLRGGDVTENAALMRQLLKPSVESALEPKRALVLLNAAWVLYVSGLYTESLAQCYDVVRLSIESGAAQQKLIEVQQCVPRSPA